MKLRNIPLSAVLFLFVGIASAAAEDPADEDARRETIYTSGAAAVPEVGNTYAQYFLETAGNDSLSTALFRYDGAVATEDVGYAADYEKDGVNAAFHDDPASVDDEASPSDAAEKSGETEPDASDVSRAPGSDGLHAYDFTVPYEYSITSEIGFTGPEDGADDPDAAVAESPVAASDDSRASDKGFQLVLAFEKNAFKNSQIKAQFIEGDSRIEAEEEAGILSLSTPIALLFVGLGVGIVVVMHTVTENKS